MKGKQAGFTLVELMLATAFFSFILIFVLNGFLQVTRAYNKGIITKQVNETTRLVLEDLTRTISTATSKGGSAVRINADKICVGGTRYRWHQGFRSPSDIGLIKVRDNLPCSDPIDLAHKTSTELVDDRVAILNLQVTPLSSLGNAYAITVTAAANTNDLISGSGSSATCNGASGDEFCSVVTLSTAVSLRN